MAEYFARVVAESGWFVPSTKVLKMIDFEFPASLSANSRE